MGFFDKIELPGGLPGEPDSKPNRPNPDTVRVYAPAELISKLKKKDEVSVVYGPAGWFKPKKGEDDEFEEVYGPAEWFGGKPDEPEEPDDVVREPVAPDEMQPPVAVYGPAEWFSGDSRPAGTPVPDQDAPDAPR